MLLLDMSLLKNFVSTSYKNWVICKFSAVYLKSSNCNGRRKLEDLYQKTTLSTQSCLSGFPYKSLLILKFIELSWGYVGLCRVLYTSVGLCGVMCSYVGLCTPM